MKDPANDDEIRVELDQMRDTARLFAEATELWEPGTIEQVVRERRAPMEAKVAEARTRWEDALLDAWALGEAHLIVGGDPPAEPHA